MTSKEVHVKESYLQEYSQHLSQRLSDYYFIDHQFIGGKDIIKFCDIKQVNLFLIKSLLGKWQEETAQLKSPYFDFNHPETKKALQVFMNTLSQHIHIHKEDFNPLLEKSIQDSLRLVIQPQHFFLSDIQALPASSLQVAQFEKMAKYLHINKKIWVEFIEQVKALPELNPNQVEEALNRAYEAKKEWVEPMSNMLQNFSDIAPLDIAQLLGQEAPIEEKAVDFSPPEKTVLIDEHPTQLDQDASFQSNIVYEEKEEESSQNKTLNDSFKSGQSQNNLADQFSSAKVQNLRSVISLNLKFQFINKLFNGDSFAFNEAIDKLGACQSYAEVQRLLNEQYFPKYQWDPEGEEVQNLLKILERKFN